MNAARSGTRATDHRPASDVVVVGAGAAGLMAAIEAADRGASVLLVERLDEPGRKLLATGGGRCNVANTAPSAHLAAAFGRQGRAILPSIEAFGLTGLRRRFGELGLSLESPDGFHLYPGPPSSRAVRDALWHAARQRGVTLRCAQRVAGLHLEAGRCAGVRCANGEILRAGAVVLAAGGTNRPDLGSDGSGHAIAREAGLRVRGPWPALAPILTAEAWTHALAGLSLPDAVLWIEAGARRPTETWRGSLLFTHQGLSGPAALDASGRLAEALAGAEPPQAPGLRLRWCGSVPHAEWLERIAVWRERGGARRLPNLLAGDVPASAARALALRLGLADSPCARWSRTSIGQVADALDGTPLRPVGTGGFTVAMATRGGVSLRDVDSRTLRSRPVEGLFLAGELLDLDGPCGGYNLLWAFSSGALSGRSAAASTRA